MPPHFTVGIPVYNAMPYLMEAMHSIMAQTFRHFEILAINDGSTDDSLAYLSSLRDPRLRVLSQENRGLTFTLNRLLNEARTRWLVRMDADDVSTPDRMAILCDQVRANPRAGMFYSRAKHHLHPGPVAMVRSTEGDPKTLRALTRQGYLLSICHSSVALNVRKSLALGGYRFDLHVEDLDLWWRMALAHDIRFIPEATVAYRLNNMSVCSRNLRELSCNTLYVQYLLLSHLWNLSPQPLNEVRPVFDTMLDERRFHYRESMWKAAIAVSERQYVRASGHLVRSAITSPGRFLQRCFYPFKRNSVARVGEAPRLFSKFGKKLWPDAPKKFPKLSFAELTANS